MAAGTSQQLWLFDIVHFNQIGGADAAAIATWYATNAQGNIVVDARSYGSWYTPAAELPLTANDAHAFSMRCGGLWVGTDDAPTWTQNGNPVLARLAYGVVTGVHGGVAVATSVSAHELLTNPNVINLGGVHAFATPGVPPTGLQPDGTTLQVLFSNGVNGAPLTSLSLASNFCCVEGAEICDVDDDEIELLLPPDVGPGDVVGGRITKLAGVPMNLPATEIDDCDCDDDGDDDGAACLELDFEDLAVDLDEGVEVCVELDLADGSITCETCFMGADDDSDDD